MWSECFNNILLAGTDNDAYATDSSLVKIPVNPLLLLLESFLIQ